MFRLLFPLMATSLFAAPTLKYPTAARGDTVEEFHGKKIADPYRWLEELDSPATRSFVEAQAKLTEGYLQAIPGRDAIRASLKKLWDYDRLGLPVSEAGRVFFSRRKGLQNQSVLFWKASPDAEEKVLLDPNSLSKDGTTALGSWSVSRNGKLLAYSLSSAGSDWVDIHFMDIDSGKKLPDVLKWVKFSQASWNEAGTGVYYSRYTAPEPGENLKSVNLNQRLYFHALGDAQDKDTLLHERPDDPKMKFGAWETDDGKYLVLSASRSTDPINGVWFRAASAKGTPPFQPIFDKFDADYNFVGNEGTTFFFLTDKASPNKRLIAVDAEAPGEEKWRTLIAEDKFPLQDVSFIGGKFVVTRLVDAVEQVATHDVSGKLLEKLATPPMAAIGGFRGRQNDTVTHYFASGYTLPGQIFRYDLTSGKSTLVSEIKAPFDPSEYQAEQHFVTSKDGTKIPLFLVSKKSAPKSSGRPTILYGYGGFDIAMGPGFSPSTIAWLDQGGLYAVACLRGGGEYGRAWHDAGRLLKKQNVFDDFIAAGEWLIKAGYTGKGQLAIKGGSNGGLLTAACGLQRPELFGAVLSAVGVHDMLRFQKFTIGWAWQDEYGHIENAADFTNMLRYSPLHVAENAQAMPPTMITTGDHDDRVFPAHSFKLAAALQHQLPAGNPILLRVDINAGHGAGKPTSKALDETADEFAFLLKHLPAANP
jgi:prolyl oligopeptidase